MEKKKRSESVQAQIKRKRLVITRWERRRDDLRALQDIASELGCSECYIEAIDAGIAAIALNLDTLKRQLHELQSDPVA